MVINARSFVPPLTLLVLRSKVEASKAQGDADGVSL